MLISLPNVSSPVIIIIILVTFFSYVAGYCVHINHQILLYDVVSFHANFTSLFAVCLL